MKPFAFLARLLCVFTMFSGGARADDSNSSGVGGNWRMLKAEHKQVQMVSEIVRIVQQSRGGFQTTADFVFRNHGPAITVTMGFPEEKYGVDAGDSVSMRHFKTWVDGRRVLARRRRISQERDLFDALWIKKVRFGRDATRRIRVSYLGGNGGGDSSGEEWVSYDFTGGNWRGKLREAILDIRFLPGWYRFETLQDEARDNPSLWRRGAHFRWRWTNWQAQKEFEMRYRTVFPNELLVKNRERDKSMFLAVEPGKVPLFDGLPYSREYPQAILLDGHLWIQAQALTQCEWSEKRHGMILRMGKRACFVSGHDATVSSRKWPFSPKHPFWVVSQGEHRLFVPARFIMWKLGGKFDIYNNEAFYQNGKNRKTFASDPN